MWKLKAINWITNLFGGVAGVTELIQGLTYIQADDWGHGIAEIAKGIGLMTVAYFVGKKASDETVK